MSGFRTTSDGHPSRLGSVNLVVGGQFGSEAKGHVAHRLIRQRAAELDTSAVSVVSARVGGPNAGHTVVDDNGVSFPLRTVPVGAVTDGCQLVICAGSEIEIPVLIGEIEMLQAAGHKLGGRFFIDPEATLVEDRHKATEHGDLYRGHRDLVTEIGSTGKGIGAARADRIMRRAARVGDSRDLVAVLGIYGVAVRDTAEHLRGQLSAGATIVIEGTQGYGLGLHAGLYPYCTSTDCRGIDLLAQAGINPWHIPGITGHYTRNLPNHPVQTWVVVRPYPIRVAGNSGPLGGETTWEQLGLEPEITTVTKKTRRVGLWDPELVNRAVRANGGGHPDLYTGAYSSQVGMGPVRIAFTMADQVIPAIHQRHGDIGPDGKGPLLEDFFSTEWLGNPNPGPQYIDWIRKIERDAGERVALVTTGPNTGIWITK